MLVLTTASFMMIFFWILAMCGLVGRSQHFREAYWVYFKSSNVELGLKKDYNRVAGEEV
jgi:hypothetical protein